MIALLCLWALVAQGCDAINGPSDLEREIARHQGIIQAYAEGTTEADARYKRLLKVWHTANAQTTLKAHKSAVAANVLPALDAYLKQLHSIPVGSPELASIHGLWVGPYEGLRDALSVYLNEVTEDNHRAAYDKVDRAYKVASDALPDYRTQLRTYYARNRVDLVEPEPAAATGQIAPHKEAPAQ